VLEAITSLLIATTLLLGSPGPVPLALAASSGAFGVRQSIPFLIGVLSGLAVAISLGSAGILALFAAYPGSRLVVGILGALYICYVAFKIASAPILSAQEKRDGLAPTFRDGFMLNLLNPKAYAAFVALFSKFMLPLSSDLTSAAATALVIFCVAIAVDGVWLALGKVLTPVFESANYGRPIRVGFGLMMVIAVFLAFRST